MPTSTGTTPTIPLANVSTPTGTNAALKIGTKTQQGMWAFDRSNEWTARYGSCSKKATRTAPLNIDISKVSPCNALCRLSVKYEPTTCSISMINNIPTVTFSPNCIIKFKNDFFYLRKMTIHYTSMHTVNDNYYDLEVLLYHNRNPINDADGGVILCILMKKGVDYGKANAFMNEFINQMPANDMPTEQDVTVSDTWCPDSLFPSAKSFFYYDGALPYPPCNPNWSLIIFEESVPISKNIIETVKYILGPSNKNIRPIQRTPPDTSIFYNANSQFDGVQDMSNSAADEAKIAQADTISKLESLQKTSWLKQNIYLIKGVLISIILILMIYVAIKIASVIVKNDLLNSMIIKQLKKRENRQSDKSQTLMAKQQAADYGGAAPVTPTDIGNNNNNNNNN
jgi:carbonic anhydrase